MRIKLSVDAGELEYGVGVTLDAGLFRAADSAMFSVQRLWASKGQGVLQFGAWIRRDTSIQAIEQFFEAGRRKEVVEGGVRLQRLKPIAEALEKFAKQAGAEGHGALGFALMCFSSAIEEAAKGVPLNLDALQARINSGTAEARRKHELAQRYAELAKGAVPSDADAKQGKPDAETPE